MWNGVGINEVVLVGFIVVVDFIDSSISRV